MTRGSQSARSCAGILEGHERTALDDGGPDISAVAHDAAQGHVVYLTDHGERLAAIVPAEFAAALEGMTPIRRGNCWKIWPMSPWSGTRWTSPARTSPPSRSGPSSA